MLSMACEAQLDGSWSSVLRSDDRRRAPTILRSIVVSLRGRDALSEIFQVCQNSCFRKGDLRLAFLFIKAGHCRIRCSIDALGT